MRVPFVDLTLPTEQIKDAYLNAVKQLLATGYFILNEDVDRFERSWAQMLGAKHCIGTSSGADALYLALRALDIGQGDEVITQGNAYNATVAAIMRTGAKPRFVDIDKDTLIMDVDKLESLIRRRTKVILPVHLYGQPNDMETIMAIAKQHNLRVVEDCAQAHLAQFKNRYVGTWGDIAAFSFYPTKNLGAFGDAGAVVTNDENLAAKVLVLHNLGQIAKDEHTELGFNMRLDPIQALCLELKLKYLEENTTMRQLAAAHYDALLDRANLPVKPVRRLPNATHVYHLYLVTIDQGNRDEIKAKLAERGVQTAVHYPVSVQHQPFFKNRKDLCPAADAAASQLLSLPLYPGISKDAQNYVIDTLIKILKS